jgi:pyruvate dehydrogenase E2 component (dihydrolipoamide acetyltransferase)
MEIEIVVPQVGEAVSEVTLVEWLKQEGDEIQKGDVLFTVDTDKAVVEVEAFAEGTLSKILVPAGSAVMPQDVVALLEGEGEEQAADDRELSERDLKSEITASPVAQRVARERGVDLARVEGTGPGGQITAQDVRLAAGRPQGKKPGAGRRAPASPKAKRLAQESGVDLANVSGSGEGGLITAADVQASIQRDATAASRDARITPFSKRREAVAQRMSLSKQEIPHFYLMMDVDMSAVNELREHCVSQLGWERPPTYTDLIVKACALALRELPSLNATFTESGRQGRASIDIGVAVGLEDGLIVPIVAGADQLNLEQISQKIRSFSERAKSGRLRGSEVGQKSMVVSNLGMYDVDSFVAIIDVPDPMILAVGKVKDEVVPVDGAVVIRPYCRLTLSIDHRILDGIQGSQFLQHIKKELEAPDHLLE